MSIFNKFRKPQITARLVDKGTKAKVNIVNANFDQSITLVYMIIKQLASMLRVDPRYLMNKVIDIDKRIHKVRKDEEKQARYGKKK